MSRNKTLLSIALMAVAGAQFIVMPDARATAQRTFVASTGLDTNACSLTQPCRSFVRAITQANAGGEIIVQDSAGYGSVTITTSVSIIAPPGIYAGISVFPGLDGVTVNAPGATVVLRGLSINGQGGDIGINLLQAARLRIESCVISNMGSWGIGHRATGGEMIVLDTIVRDNLDAGITLLMTNGSVLIDHVRSEHNKFDGLHIAQNPGSGGANATIVDSVFTHNGGNGIIDGTVAGAVTTVQLERSILSNNGGEGFRANVFAFADAVVLATLTRNAISGNGGDGVLISAVFPGFATGFLLDNSVQKSGGYGINANGSGAIVRASSNVAQSISGNGDMRCANGATIYTYGNNVIEFTNGAGCFASTSGF
jgi:hypothetical protein